MIVRQLFNQLRGHIQRRALYRREDMRAEAHPPCESKVAQLRHAVRIQQHVLRLHVPIYVKSSLFHSLPLFLLCV